MIYLEIVLKSILTYILMLLFLKIIGKVGFAQLSPYDLTFILILAAVLGVPLVNPKASYLYSLIVFITGLLIQQGFSRLSLINKARPWLENKPTVLILDGKLITENMSHTQFDMNQLLAALRLKEVRNISEVELGTLEPSGEFSVIKKSTGQDKEREIATSTYSDLKNETLDSLQKEK